MAGAGYKLFNTGDVLTAAQVNTYLQEQTVMVFANATARTTALSGVLSEGMMSYLQDTNSVEVYDGSSWVNVGNVGDITEVQAGTGISVASGTGPIPVVTNTVATTFDALGDLVVGTGADTFSKLTAGANEHRLVADSAQSTGLKYVADTTNYAISAKGDLLVGTAADTLAALSVGSANQVLTVDSSTATGLKWATPAAGGKVLQVVNTTYSTEVTVASTTLTDIGNTLSITPSSASSKILILVTQNSAAVRTSNSQGTRLVIVRGSTIIWDSKSVYNNGNYGGVTSFESQQTNSVVYLDSPATTSSVTYKLQGACNTTANSGSARFFTDSAVGTITLLEIGA